MPMQRTRRGAAVSQRQFHQALREWVAAEPFGRSGPADVPGVTAWVHVRRGDQLYCLHADVTAHAAAEYLRLVDTLGDDLDWITVASRRGKETGVAFGPENIRIRSFYLYAISSKHSQSVRDGTITSASTSTRYWAVVANPDLYRVEQAISERAGDLWTVKRSDVRAGDRVAIWKAKGSGNHRGIVALGEVLTDPADLDEEPEALPYWVDGTGRGRQRRVRLRYVRPPAAPLWLGGDTSDVLADLSVARARGGVYRIKPEQWHRLVAALGGWPVSEGVQETIIEVVENARAMTNGQGFLISPEVRRAVEQHAMRRAADHFRAEGFQVAVLGKPYDLRCNRGTEVHYVEVKGTSTGGQEVLLTPNEVEFARQNMSRMVLFVCADIEVRQTGTTVEAAGGTVRLVQPWNIDDGILFPLGFQYVLPTE